MKKILFALSLFVLIQVAFSQEQKAINTDRPTQSASVVVMPKNGFQIEYGFIYDQINANLSATTFFNGLFRYGLLNGVELRLTQNIGNQKPDGFDATSGLSPLTVGTKIHIAEKSGARPQTSLIAQVTLETGEESFRPSQPVPEFRLNFQNTLSDKVSLGYNVGVGLPENDTYFLYTAVLGYALSSQLTTFVEPYGFVFENVSDHRVNAGLIYLIQPQFQVDLSAGVGLSDASPSYFVGFGAAYLF